MVVSPQIPGQVAEQHSRSTLLQRIKHWTGLDRAIAFTVLARGWAAVAGVVTVLLIAKFLTPAEQGYYYTFASLVALQIVFELGFSFVILQLAAHERARLTLHADGRIEGDAVAQSRIASILQKSVRWYSIAALLMVCTLLPAGIHFFSTHQHDAVTNWRVAWVVLVVAAGFTFQIDPVFSFLEGCGFVTNVARLRLMQAVVASSFAWIALITHHGLFAPAAVVTGQATVGFLWLARRRRLLFTLLRHPVGPHAIGWTTEIWPFQWRIAVSWLCGYFIFQLFNPVIFAYQGAVAAGRLGMSLSVVTSMGTIAMAWMNTKASPFGTLVSKKDFVSLDRVFFRTLKQSVLLLASGALVVLLCLLFASSHFPKIASRVVAPWAFAFLLATALSNHITFCVALYLRAHKEEPFMVQSVVNALLVGSSTYFLGRFVGVGAVTVGYFVASGVIGLAFGMYLFFTKRREWHNGGVDNLAVIPEPGA